MSWEGSASLLLAMGAAAVAALAVGLLLYGSMLPESEGLPQGSAILLTVTGGLFVALSMAAIWLLRRRRPRREERLDRRLWEAALGADAQAGPEDETGSGRPQS